MGEEQNTESVVVAFVYDWAMPSRRIEMANALTALITSRMEAAVTEGYNRGYDDGYDDGLRAAEDKS